jgi:hypothetical protein
MQKYKRLRGKPQRAWDWLNAARQRQPKLFTHWHLIARPQVGLWEPGEGRPSRRVLREPGGAILTWRRIGVPPENFGAGTLLVYDEG